MTKVKKIILFVLAVLMAVCLGWSVTGTYHNLSVMADDTTSATTTTTTSHATKPTVDSTKVVMATADGIQQQIDDLEEGGVLQLGGDLNVADGLIIGNNASATNKVITIDLNGHILNFSGTAASVITIRNGFTLNLIDSDATVQHPYKNSLGLYKFFGTDGVAYDSGDGVIKGGVITGGNGDLGGAVSVNMGGNFYMFGGTLAGNYAQANGGAVYVGSAITITASATATFEMQGGAICGNLSQVGGAVDLTGTMYISGGTITDNQAYGSNSQAGGIYVRSASTFQLEGKVTILGNKAGGTIDATTVGDLINSVNTPSDSNSTVTQAVPEGTFSEGSASNVYLAHGKQIEVVGAVDATSSIGVLPAGGYDKEFVTGWSNAGADAVTTVFAADYGEYAATATSSGNLTWTSTHEHEYIYTVLSDGGVLETCSKTNCPDPQGGTVLMDVDNASYSGTAHDAVLSGNFENVDHSVKYYYSATNAARANQTETTSTVNAGYYTAVLYAGDEEVHSLSFQVTKVDLIITANDNTIYYAYAPADAGVTYDGFVNGETQAVLGGTLQYAHGYSRYDSTGIYGITPAGLTSTNYNIKFERGFLTVKKLPVTATVAATSSEYGSELASIPVTITLGATGYTLPAADDDVNAKIQDDIIVMATLPAGVTKYSDAATYNVIVTTINTNYEVTVAGNANAYTIKKATAQISSVTLRGWTYGETPNDPVAAGATSGVVYSYSTEENGNYTTVRPTNAGTYWVKASVAGTSNTEASEQKAKFTIAKKVVNEPAEQPTTYTYTGEAIEYKVAASDYYTVTGNKQTKIGEDYKVTISLNDPANYVWSSGVSDNITRTFSITAGDEEVSILWLIIVLGIVLVIELVAVAVFWARHRSMEDSEPEEDTGKVNSSALGIIPLILAASIPSWQVIVVIVLAIAIVLVALINIIIILKNKGGLRIKYIEKERIIYRDGKAEVDGQEMAITLVNPNDLQLTTIPTQPVFMSDGTGELTEVLRSVDKDTGMATIIRFRKSFEAKYIQASDEAKDYYTALKNEILSYKKTRSRVSWNYDNIMYGRDSILRFNVRGKTLCLYFALDPDSLDQDKYKVERSESKRYEDVPCLYRIKNQRRVNLAIELMSMLAEKYGMKRGEDQHGDYYVHYESTESLLQRRLIKEYYIHEKYADYIRKRKEQTIVEDEGDEERDNSVDD